MAMISIIYPCKIMSFLIFLSILISFPYMGSSLKDGFSVEMIHFDFSPKSPFYNPNETHYQRVYKSLFFDNNNINPEGVDPKGPVYRYYGSYLLQLSIGTPPVSILGTLDTGSNWIWTRCFPCARCVKQEAPLFDSTKSNTYFRMTCQAEGCKRFVPGSGCIDQNGCGFSIAYVDGWHCEGSTGEDQFSLDTVSSAEKIRKVMLFGCTHSDGGGNSNPKSTGIIGMGAGPTSLVSQLNVNDKFSYCLVQNQAQSSMLNFGLSAVVSGPGTVSTPVVYRAGYVLTLKGVSVNNNGAKVERFNYPAASPGQPGNIIIDSCTPQTYLDPSFYQTIRDGVMSRVFLPPVVVKGFDLCYNTSSTISFNAPTITMHFEGADVELTTVNTFLLVSRYTACFTFQPNTKSKGKSFYGSIAQINFLVGYDMEKVSFKPVFDCSTSRV